MLRNANPHLAHPDMHRRITYLLLAAFYPCAYLFETCLAWATFEYYARMISLGPTWTRLFCLAGPLAVIVIEILISLERYEAHEEVLDGESPARYRWWTLAGILAITLMPAFALATQLVADSTLASVTAFRLKTYAITGLAFLVHGCVVFSGGRAHEAKSFVLFTFHDSRLAILIRCNDAKWRRWSQASARAFVNYWHALDRFNRDYPSNSIAPGPFDQVTRDFLNAWFGHPIVGGPTGQNQAVGGNPTPGNGPAPVPPAASSPPVAPAGSTPQAPSPPAPSAPLPPAATPAPQPSSAPAPAPSPASDTGGADDAATGELEYLRQLLTDRVRQADGEVGV